MGFSAQEAYFCGVLLQKRPTKRCCLLYTRTIELICENNGVFCTRGLFLWVSFAKETYKTLPSTLIYTRPIELTPENILQVVLFRSNGEISGEFIAVKGAAEALKHRCCSVLQCVAVCCSVLQCVAVCCRVLPCAAVCCRVLQCVAVFCSMFRARFWANLSPLRVQPF